MTRNWRDGWAQSIETDERDWQNTARRDTAEAYRAFIRRRPFGVFAAAARERLHQASPHARSTHRNARRPRTAAVGSTAVISRMLWALTSFRGRLGLSEFWMAILVYLPLVHLVTGVFVVSTSTVALAIGVWPLSAPAEASFFSMLRGNAPVVTWILTGLDIVLILFFLIALLIKRYQDLGYGLGRFLVHLAVPVIGWLILLVGAAVETGQIRSNRFGAGPRPLPPVFVIKPLVMLMTVLGGLAFLALIDVEQRYGDPAWARHSEAAVADDRSPP